MNERGIVFSTDEATWCGICRIFERATGMPLEGVFLLNEAVAGVPGLSLPEEAAELEGILWRDIPEEVLAEVVAECGIDRDTLQGAARRFVAFSRASGGWVVRTPTRA